jgi:CBS domain-containing protein
MGGLDMSTVADILRKKGSEVFTIADTATVFDAIKEMSDKGVGCLVVMRGESIRGILTERDYLRKIALQGRHSKDTPVPDIMTESLVVASPQDTVESCMAVMTEKRIRHLPVVDQGKLAGLVSVGDLIKQIASRQKAEIRYLTDYISGKYPG